jgi:hypothetical protein
VTICAAREADCNFILQIPVKLGVWNLAPDTCPYSLLGLALAGSLGLLDSFFFFSGSFFSVAGEESAEELSLALVDFFA